MDPKFLFQTIIAGQVDIEFSVLGVKWPEFLTVSISTHMTYEFHQLISLIVLFILWRQSQIARKIILY